MGVHQELRNLVLRRRLVAQAVLSTIFLAGSMAHAQSNSLLWSRANSSGAAPSPREDAPIAFDTAGRELFLFGGLDASGDRNDLWAYSIDNQQWREINPLGQPPSSRHGHTVTFDPVRRRIIVIAGMGQGFFGDAWAYDIQTNAWNLLAPESAGPLPRYGLSAIYDSKRDRIVISHGFTTEGRFDDTWALDLATSSWSEISPAGVRPLRRCLHHAVYVPQNDQMFLYGGCSSGYGPCPQGDLWSFDLAKNQWTEIVTAVQPPPRERYGMVFDDHREKLVLFGGLGALVLNDTWEYDPASVAWTQIAPAGDIPEPRYRLEATFVSDANTAFFFGGDAGGFTNDLLLLSANGPAIPKIAAGGIVDVFSGAGGPFAPGEIVAIYGGSLGPSAGIASVFDPVTATLPTTLGNASVDVNGVSAALFFVSYRQTNLQIPYEMAGLTQANISVHYGGVSSVSQTVQIAPTAPRLYPGAFNQDGTLNSTGNPADAGSIIVLFATGQGVTNPATPTGKMAIAPYAPPVGAVRVSIGGQDAEIVFSGLAPGTAGVMQVNARLPVGISGNAAVPVLLTVGDGASQNGVAVAVR